MFVVPRTKMERHFIGHLSEVANFPIEKLKKFLADI